jgi:hypothetical protein
MLVLVKDSAESISPEVPADLDGSRLSAYR